MSKPSAAIFLSILMCTSLASAGTSNWNGNSSLSGPSESVNDAFQIPGNETVIDAWLHVDESGYLSDGTGITWNGDNTSNNFNSGISTNTTSTKFDGILSLAPDSAVSNVESFSSAVLQFDSFWSHTGSIWDPSNPSNLGGTVSGPTRTLAHGYVPAAAYSGGVVAATLPGQGLPSSSYGTLVSPQTLIPTPVNLFNLSFAQWHHLDVNDGAWVEYKLDQGNWTYMTPSGGYPDTISTNATVPNGANVTNGSGFGVFGDGNHSGWNNVLFNLDNLTGIQNATNIQFRFVVWTDSNSTSRPGWFLDEISLLNVGASTGYWHHGCYVSSGTCGYSNSANAALQSSVNLSATTTGAEIQTKLEWDLEGSGYDNFCVEMSDNNGTSWVDISSGTSSTVTSCRSRTGAIPGSGYTLPNGTFVGDQSGGFVTLNFPIPSSMIGSNNTTLLRYVVETDTSVMYGSPQDNYEGLTVDWFKVIDANGSVLSTNNLDQNSATDYSINNGANDWAYLQIGTGGFSGTDGFENSPALPPGGWTTQSQSGQTGWEFGAICSNYTTGPSAYPSPSLGFGTVQCGTYDASSDNSLITPQYYVPIGSSAGFVWQHWMCSEDLWDGGALYVSVNNGSWYQAYVSTGNNTNWYDGSITNGPFAGTDVWDGRQYVAAAGQWSCTGVTIPWMNMSYDVSNLSGNYVSFKFRQMADTAVQEPGWYVDDIGLEVDWFETEGSWRSPMIPVHDLGYGFADADLMLPNNTWYGVDILDATGQIIPGHGNLSFPISLASIDRDANAGIYLQVNLGTSDEYYTPLIKEISVGATRYFGASNGWNIPSSLTQLANGTWENTGGSTITVTGETGFSSRPISSANVTGSFSQVTASLLTSCLLYTSPSPRDKRQSRMPSSA